MKRIDLKSQDTHFIGSWNIGNDDLCKEMINFFEGNKKLQGQGSVSSGVDSKIKKTTDIVITPNDLKKLEFKCFNNYISELHKCFIDYQDQWPFVKSMLKEVDLGSFYMLKYLTGDHFAKFHTERSSIGTLHRIFAWMTYLNDVDDGGATAFTHYGMKIKPERGKTIIWPAEWTHAHAGEILNSGVKYVISGCMHFPYDNLESKK